MTYPTETECKAMLMNYLEANDDKLEVKFIKKNNGYKMKTQDQSKLGPMLTDIVTHLAQDQIELDEPIRKTSEITEYLQNDTRNGIILMQSIWAKKAVFTIRRMNVVSVNTEGCNIM